MALSSLNKRILDFLRENKALDEKKLVALETEAHKSGKNLEEIAVTKKIFTPEDFNKLKSQIFSLPLADLSEMEIESSVLNLLAKKVADNYQIIVFGRQGRTVRIGLVNPADLQAKEAIEFLAAQQDFDPEYHVISLKDFRKALDQYSGFKKEIGTAMESAKEKFEEREELFDLGKKGEDLESVVRSAPVAKIVSVIIKHALEGGASDIHIEPGQNEGRVRYRVDGILHTSLVLPEYLYSSVVSRIKVLANLKLDETRIPQDGRIRVQAEDQLADLRVSVLPTLDQEKVVMRVLDTSAGVPTLAELGFAPYHIGIIERNMKKSFGLFLLTGPTGSGKTTTLYSVLNILNAEDQNITTLEDPIEYYVEGVNQSQINPEIGYSFASGLRAILRQDPNIIMVGEIRDNETAELVIHAGLTGHLVFSTLHTNDAWGAIPRLFDMKAEPFLLSSTLNLVMAQRLVRRVCQDCKKEVELAPKAKEKIEAAIKEMPEIYSKEIKGKPKFFHGEGCPSCGKTGYAGRTVVAEILEINSDFQNLIARDFSFNEVKEELKKQNFLSLFQDGILKAAQGFTTLEEVIRISQN
ncbi:MAG: GspE/PulE family protein [Patescibacteria group bacterium]